MSPAPVSLSHTPAGPAGHGCAKAGRWGHVEARHVVLAAAGCVGLAVVALVDPAVTRLAPPCPLQALTGLDCPLCGATRATHQLLRGDVLAALDLNALYVVLLPVLAVVAGWWLVRGRAPAAFARARWGLVAVAAAFFVARNLPWAPFTWLGT